MNILMNRGDELIQSLIYHHPDSQGGVASSESNQTTDPEQETASRSTHDDTHSFDGTITFDHTQPLVRSQLVTAGIASSRPFAAWAKRDIGRIRKSNQDNVYAGLMSLPQGESDIPVGLFIIADGMGGHSGGEVASRKAVEVVLITMLEQLALPALSDEEPGSSLPIMIVSAVQEANQKIWEAAQAAGSQMGTTCTAALLVDNNIYLAHVGDSRAYTYAGTTLQQITTDHSTVGRLIAMGQLNLEDARDHPLRSQLYRTVGQTAHVDVDAHHLETEGLSHLLLCSDGLWSMVDDEDIAAIIRESPYPQDICRRLIAQANMAGGEDNISVVVVSFPSEQGTL